jgi:RNA polymerase sigma factor (TIGR02999 family)
MDRADGMPDAPDSPPDATTLLRAWRAGDPAALDRLMPLVHAELRRIAKRLLSREAQARTLQPTALVNEAFLRLVTVNAVEWQSRAHFLAMAARLMRRVLVDAARARRAHKRGDAAQHVTLDTSVLGQAIAPSLDVIAVHDALEALSRLDARKSQVVELRFFGGLSHEEIAETLAVSTDTVMRDWKFARAWLRRSLSEDPAPRDRRGE